MATDRRSGPQAALDALAEGHELPEAGGDDGEQVDMFGDSALLPTLRVPTGPGQHREVRRAGPGRPPGSKNRATQQLIDMVTKRYGHPVLRLAELAATPIDVLAKTLGCSMLEAAEFSRKCQNDLAPYIAQKLPQMHQIESKSAGLLVVDLGGMRGGEGAFGLDMKLVQNQGLGDGDDEKSETESRTDGEK